MLQLDMDTPFISLSGRTPASHQTARKPTARMDDRYDSKTIDLRVPTYLELNMIIWLLQCGRHSPPLALIPLSPPPIFGIRKVRSLRSLSRLFIVCFIFSRQISRSIVHIPFLSTDGRENFLWCVRCSSPGFQRTRVGASGFGRSGSWGERLQVETNARS
jgi:hypothetical protein